MLFRSADAGANNIIIYNGFVSPIGIWSQVTYNAGNFSNSGGTSWTVDNADQLVFEWSRAGKTLSVNLVLVNTSVTGAVTGLLVKIPNGYLANKRAVIPFTYKNGASYGTGAADIDPAGGGYISLLLDVGGSVNWTAGANSTNVYLDCSFEVQ